MELALVVVIALVLILFVGAMVLVLRKMGKRAQTLRRERDRLESVVEGHRDMAASHESSVEELVPRAKAHREAAIDHEQRAERLEGRIERELRHAQFHAERAAETEDERGNI